MLSVKYSLVYISETGQEKVRAEAARPVGEIATTGHGTLVNRSGSGLKGSQWPPQRGSGR